MHSEASELGKSYWDFSPLVSLLIFGAMGTSETILRIISEENYCRYLKVYFRLKHSIKDVVNLKSIGSSVNFGYSLLLSISDML